MAAKTFDFKSLSTQKLVDFNKQNCKPTLLKQAKGGIVLLEYKMAGKKIPCVFIPFKKLNEAFIAFKQVKNKKIHVLKKVAYVSVAVEKENITLNILKGGATAETISAKGSDFFASSLKLNLNIGSSPLPQQETSESPSLQPDKNDNSTPNNLAALSKATKQSFNIFKTELLADLKNRTLSTSQLKQLEQVSQDFDSFVIEYNKAGYPNAYKAIMDAIQKAAALIAKFEPKTTNEGQGADIINNDNVFSQEEKAAIKDLVSKIKAGLPLIKTQVVPNLKANKTTDEDKQILTELLDKIARFEENYHAAPAPVKDKLAKFHDTVVKQEKQLKAILQKLEGQAAKNLNAILTPEQYEELMSTTTSDLQDLLGELEALRSTLLNK